MSRKSFDETLYESKTIQEGSNLPNVLSRIVANYATLSMYFLSHDQASGYTLHQWLGGDHQWISYSFSMAAHIILKAFICDPNGLFILEVQDGSSRHLYSLSINMKNHVVLNLVKPRKNKPRKRTGRRHRIVDEPVDQKLIHNDVMQPSNTCRFSNEPIRICLGDYTYLLGGYFANLEKYQCYRCLTTLCIRRDRIPYFDASNTVYTIHQPSPWLEIASLDKIYIPSKLIDFVRSLFTATVLYDKIYVVNTVVGRYHLQDLSLQCLSSNAENIHWTNVPSPVTLNTGSLFALAY